MQLSKNLSLEQFEHSNYAEAHDISNFLPPEMLSDAINLATKLYEPILTILGAPPIITSGYRCPELNKAIRGVATSQHTKGQAMDFVPSGVNIHSAFDKIVESGLTWDQLIKEHDAKGSIWIHISLKRDGNRQQVIKDLEKK